MTPTLYLTRNGLLEPLGQSQVLAYLRGLSKTYRITLITYEKDEDWADADRVTQTRAECEALGIRWLPQHFRSTRLPVGAMLAMVRLTLRETRGQKVRLIHARSYIPAAVAYVVGRLTGVPFIFDMRALWPEELITAGRLNRGSIIHRAIVAAERAGLKRAAAVVSLTHAAVDYLNGLYPREMTGQRVAVIPTCADLDRFVPAGTAPDTAIYGCLGTVLSGWFRIDWLAAFLETAARRDPAARFELTTRDDPDDVRAAIGGTPEVQDRISIAPSPPGDVPAVIQKQTASVMYFTDGLSKLGSSPTRMGEILGCGLPVMANDGVGDVARIVRDHNVGVLAAGPAPEQMETAWNELQALLDDPELAGRCRRAAEEIFSLQAGTEAYARIYADILSNGASTARAKG